jgi:hypothetical protein
MAKNFNYGIWHVLGGISPACSIRIMSYYVQIFSVKILPRTE